MVRKIQHIREAYNEHNDIIGMVADLEEYVKENVQDQTNDTLDIRAMQITNMGSYDLFELVIYDARYSYIEEIGTVELKYKNNQWDIEIYIKYEDSILKDNITTIDLNDVKEYIVKQIMNFYWYELPDDWQ